MFRFKFEIDVDPETKKFMNECKTRTDGFINESKRKLNVTINTLNQRGKQLSKSLEIISNGYADMRSKLKAEWQKNSPKTITVKPTEVEVVNESQS